MEGGVGAFTREMAHALHDQTHEVHIITSRDAGETKNRPSFGRLSEPDDLGYAQLHADIGRWRWPSVSTIAEITLRYEFDVINIQYQAAAYNMNSPAINFLPWRLKHLGKTVVTFHDLRTPYLFPKAGRFREKALTMMASQSSGAITTNTADFDELRSRVETPVANIPIGSNIATYKPNHIEIDEVRHQLNLQHDEILLGYFGFLNESKGAETLLEALSRLPGTYHLAFIGGQIGASDPTNSAYLNHVQNLVNELDLANRVHWTGFISDIRVSTFLHTANLMVLPYRDGVSLRRGSLMAALAHGRPLITTAPKALVPELRHGENVWLVPPNDVLALAKSIRHLANEKAICRELGQKAAATAQLFSWDEIARRTVQFYKSLKDPREKGVPRR